MPDLASEGRAHPQRNANILMRVRSQEEREATKISGRAPGPKVTGSKSGGSAI